VSLEETRRTYAEGVLAAAKVDSPALRDAFARVPRERFLGPGPWLIAQPQDPANPYRPTPDAELEHIYRDVVVAIDPARMLNNGMPSALAMWIGAADVRSGDAVLHIGCGTGYYTAILAELVGPRGRVDACDIDRDLAGRARANLEDRAQVRVEASDGSAPRGPFDVIFVNAGATHARREWIAALAPGGRLTMPLTVNVPHFPHGVGIFIRVDRAETSLPVRVVSPVAIYDCAGARSEEADAELHALLAPGAVARIKALSLDPHPRGPGCVVHVDSFCLQE
jgi:protein-L-isoaspartate(D-aspartate) O-methyltransferase